MLKRTHMSAGLLVSLPLIMSDPISIIGLLGTIAPDRLEFGAIEHRTVTHGLLFNAISTLIVSMFNYKIGMVWGICYLSHLIADSFTVTGIPFLYPFDKKYYGFRCLKVGSRAELCVQLLLVYVLINIFVNYK
jgi:inner membrane protein